MDNKYDYIYIYIYIGTHKSKNKRKHIFALTKFSCSHFGGRGDLKMNCVISALQVNSYTFVT